MKKVYVLMYDIGSWDDYSKEIHGIYLKKEDAEKDKIELEDKNNIIKNRYSSEEIEKFQEELFCIDEEINMPKHLQDYENWCFQEKYNSFFIVEHELR